MTESLRIGILGAARIADEGIVTPARTLGHEVVAVAARDRTRAEAFAAERGIATVHDTYADVIADPDVDLVYNALVNSLHARWNIAALQAGQDVLSEKPLAGRRGHHGPGLLRARRRPPARSLDRGRAAGRARGRHAAGARGGRGDARRARLPLANAELIDDCYRRAGLSPRAT